MLDLVEEPAARPGTGAGAGPDPPFGGQPDRLEVAPRRRTGRSRSTRRRPRARTGPASWTPSAPGWRLLCSACGSGCGRPPSGTRTARRRSIRVLPARLVVPLPDVASFDLGAALGVPFITAHRCLTVAEDGPLRLGPGTLQGRTVLDRRRRRGGRQRRHPVGAVVRRDGDHHGQQPGQGPARGGGGRGPRDRLPRDGRGGRGPQDRPERRRRRGRGRAGAERRDRRRRPRHRRHGGDLRQQRRRRVTLPSGR